LSTQNKEWVIYNVILYHAWLRHGHHVTTKKQMQQVVTEYIYSVTTRFINVLPAIQGLPISETKK